MSHSRLLFVPLVALSMVTCGGSSLSSPTVAAIGLSPDPCVVGRTDSMQMAALATRPDGTKKDVTHDPQTYWRSDNPSVATVSASGVLVGVNAGVATIVAAFEGAAGSVDCTVAPVPSP